MLFVVLVYNEDDVVCVINTVSFVVVVVCNCLAWIVVMVNNLGSIYQIGLCAIYYNIIIFFDRKITH